MSDTAMVINRDNLARPVAATGEPVRNALLGSLMIVGLSVLVSTPVGILAGVNLAEYGDTS